VCGSAHGSVWQCAQQYVVVRAAVCGCPAVQQCMAVRQCAAARAAVCGRVQQCAAGFGRVRQGVAVSGRAAVCGNAAVCICFCLTVILFVFKCIRLNLN
jgi:hypothetical protein